MVMAQGDPNGPGLEPGGAGAVRGEGMFVISGLVPADYVLHVRAFFDEGELARMAYAGRVDESAFAVPISTRGGSLTDLRIVVPPPVTLTGRAVFEGRQTSGPQPPVRISASMGGQMGSSGAQADAGGRFQMSIRPGAYTFLVWPPEGWMVKRMEFRGREVDGDEPVEITAEPGARLDVVLTSQLTALAGTVVDGRNRAVRDYQVVVFPKAESGPSSWDYRRTRIERGGADGRFTIEGLPPGDYLAAAVDGLDAENGIEPDVMDALRDVARPVRIEATKTETIALRLTLLP
jgi:hypothetical protein